MNSVEKRDIFNIEYVEYINKKMLLCVIRVNVKELNIKFYLRHCDNLVFKKKKLIFNNEQFLFVESLTYVFRAP